MSPTPSAAFQSAMTVASRRAQLGKCAVLAWIAASSGSISESAHQQMREYVTADDDSILNMALGVVQRSSPDDLILACRSIQELPVEARRVIMFQAVSVALADRKLTPAANHILRFLADLLEINLGEFFQRCAKKPLPEPGDPSSVQYWGESMAARESSGGPNSNDAGTEHKRADSRNRNEDHSKKKRKRGMTRLEALSILGLESDVSDESIAQAYRRLANIHHPDRFSQAGEASQRSAAKTFARINEAYESLTHE